LHLRSATEPSTWGYDPVTGIPVSPAPAGATQVFQRRCWNHHPDGTPYNIPGATFFDPTNAAELPDPIPDSGFSPQGDIRYYQGDIGTHGLHILFITDSDNAQLTVPVDEIDSEQRQVILRGDPGNVGDQYGHSFDKDRKSTRLNSSHVAISYAVFCLKKKTKALVDGFLAILELDRVDDVLSA